MGPADLEPVLDERPIVPQQPGDALHRHEPRARCYGGLSGLGYGEPT